MSRQKFSLMAVLVIVAASLAPGIRGYENWAFHEVALLYFGTRSYVTWLYLTRVQQAPRHVAGSTSA